MKPFSTCILFASVLFFAVGPAAVYGQSLFITPYSTRTYGMGLSGVADDTDPGNSYYNPALLGTLNGFALRADLQPDIYYPGDDNQGWSTFLAGSETISSRLFVAAGLLYARQDREHRWTGKNHERSTAASVAVHYSISTNMAIGLGVDYARAPAWKTEHGGTPFDFVGMYFGYSFAAAASD